MNRFSQTNRGFICDDDLCSSSSPSLINQFTDNLNTNELMHNYSSDRFLSTPPQLRINSQEIDSIPPGCQKQKITGVFTLRLVTNYLNTMRQSLIFRCKLWGMEGNGIILEEGADNQHIMNLNIRSTIQNITKYFKDMKVICIDILQGNSKERTGSLQRKKVPSDYKHIGWIFVNPQRYIINHVLNDFEEVVSIIDLRKQKIGEANVKISIQMNKAEELFIHPTQPIITRPESITQKLLPMRQDKQDSLKKIKPNRDDNNYNAGYDLQERRHKPSFDEQSIEQSIDHIQDRRIKIREEEFLPQFKRKSRAQQFLQQYHKNKPKHSELSLIREKYGFNNPSVQVMKLKYDEVQLLSNVSEDNIKEEPRINLLLKAIKVESKAKIDSLSIYCEQRRQKLKTQTKIFLNEPGSNQKTQINYLYTLPNEATDVLIFDIKEGKAEVEVKSLTKSDRIQIKNKNNKRIATIEYTPISNKVILENSTKIGRQKFNAQNIKPNQRPAENMPKKQKESVYVCVLNWPEHQISMKNKNFGTTSASKLLFDLNDPEFDTVEVLLQNSKRQVVYLQVKIAHLFKEQNYVIEGKQVKIISSRGALNEVLSLIDRIEPQKLQNQPKTIENQRRLTENNQQIEKLKELTNIFQLLSQSDNVQCNQLIQSLTSSPKISMPKLEKLSSIISVESSSFANVLSYYFSSNFGYFFTMFQIYHKWNHKYHRSLRKLKRLTLNTSKQSYLLYILKKVKKSKDVLFGAINSNTLLSYFTKSDGDSEKSVGQNLEGDFDNESLGRLLILHFERYFNNSIKMSQLQSFIEEEPKLINLNTYLLVKISYEIRNQLETYHDILKQEQLKFIKMFGLDRQMTGELGISKLLFEIDDQLTQSSVLSHEQEHFRKETEGLDRLRTEREDHLKTERSKEPLEKWQEEKRLYSKESEPVRVDTVQIQHEAVLIEEEKAQKLKTIPIILSDISIPNLKAIDSVKISSSNFQLQLNREELVFPKAIVLAENQLYKIEVEGDQKEWEGVFVAIKQPQTVLLYQNGEENGRLYLFNARRKETESDQIPFKIITSHKPIIEDQSFNLPEIPSNDSSAILQNMNRAKSPKVRLTIRSIRPSRPLFQFKISPYNKDEQTQTINYPSQSEVVVENSNEGWKVGLLGSDYEEISLANYVTSSTYCFANNTDKRVEYLVIIEVAQCWSVYPEIKHQDTLRLFCHLQNFIAIEEITPGNYDIILEHQKEVTQIATFKQDKPAKAVKIKACFQAQQVGNPLSIKVINTRTQQLTAQFQFTIILVAAPLSRSHRYLISAQPGHRLQLTAFQINHAWHHVKPDRIFSLFSSPSHKQTIESYLKAYGISNQEQLITWLKNNFDLALGQIDIMLNELFQDGQEAKWRQFLNVFRGVKSDGSIDVGQVMDEFRIFDLKEEGVISLQQMKLVKRILDRNFNEVSKSLSESYTQFVTSPEKDNNCIIDLNAPQSQFDYLSFIALISQNIQLDKPKPKSAKLSIVKHQSYKYLKVKLLSFNKLSINGAPSTLLFKIDGKSLADPVHRCYSHHYSNPEEIIIENDKGCLFEIYCQKLNSEGMWEYKLIESVKLQRQIKILGGSIQLQIAECQDNIVKQGKKLQKEDINESNLQVSPIKQRNQQKQQDRLERSGFQKSFWNKSLHETRQQWSKANATATNFKERRKILQLKQQQIQKKMALFDKFYEQ